jgi:hypothetical protein
MDKFWNYIIAKIKGDQIEQIQIHGIVRRDHERDFIYTPMLEIQFGDSQMMSKGIFADRRYRG